jgi:hypothetical protein
VRAALALLVLLAASPALALGEADRAAIRSVIEGQLDAFARDDAGGAWAHAAPGIQTLFPSRDRFMEMVRQGYPPVYRQRSRAFGAAEETPGGPTQAVRFVDREGAAWLAVYSLERQADGTWRISGCSLVRETDEAV